MIKIINNVYTHDFCGSYSVMLKVSWRTSISCDVFNYNFPLKLFNITSKVKDILLYIFRVFLLEKCGSYHAFHTFLRQIYVHK